jgi:TetR/AcrR family transcriptional regulator
MTQRRADKSSISRDPLATKARILDAATSEFSLKGYDGARVSAVVKRAHCNINLVYHYFGNKEQLFIAVMEHAYGNIRSHHKDMELRGTTPEQAMRGLISSTFKMFIEFPEAIGLLVSENIHRARHIKNSTLIVSMYDALLDFIRETLDRGVARGAFRSGVDATELFISINAEGYFYLSNHHTLGVILHQDLMTEQRLRQREAFIIDVIMGFLRPVKS